MPFLKKLSFHGVVYGPYAFKQYCHKKCNVIAPCPINKLKMLYPIATKIVGLIDSERSGG